MEDHLKTVLVIDDQDDERAIQRAMLGHLGYRVVEASNGLDGIRVARDSRPDLIILDIAMPRMDGFAVCRELQTDPRTDRIPIVLFTASLAAEVGEEASAAGATAVLTKPLEPKQVAAAVARLIGPGGSTPSGAPGGG